MGGHLLVTHCFITAITTGLPAQYSRETKINTPMYKIRIHHKTPTKRNPHVVAAVFVEDSDHAGAFRRFFKHRGIDQLYVLERDMTPAEIEYTKHCWRLHAYFYPSWEALIEDEWDTTQNVLWIEKLWQASGLRRSWQSIVETLK